MSRRKTRHKINDHSDINIIDGQKILNLDCSHYLYTKKNIKFATLIHTI